MPVGAIAMWSPLNGATPAGWAECDGTANAPGPDLRNRFIVGRGVDHTVDTSGGAQTHTHAGHAAHVFTQPSGHAAHVVTQPNSHADVLNHVHRENRNSATTGALDGWGAGDTSTNTPLLTGYSTANPTTGGVAAQVHAGTAVDAHSAHAGGAVDAHSSHDAPNHESKWYALIYIQRMT